MFIWEKINDIQTIFIAIIYKSDFYSLKFGRRESINMINQ